MPDQYGQGAESRALNKALGQIAAANLALTEVGREISNAQQAAVAARRPGDQYLDLLRKDLVAIKKLFDKLEYDLHQRLAEEETGSRG